MSLAFFRRTFVTVGPYAEGDDAAYALMIIGRTVFAAGYFGNIAISHQVN